MQKLKSDLKEVQKTFHDLSRSSNADCLTSVYYSCHAWGLGCFIDAIDVFGNLVRGARQKQK